MKHIQITLKNYRAFSDEKPLVFEVGPDFTAIVGPNNSGKSTVQLFFYEFRPHLQELLNVQKLFLPKTGHLSQQLQGAADQSEVFHNRNKRPLTVRIEVPDAEWYGDRRPENWDVLRAVELTAARETPDRWEVQIFGSKNLGENLRRDTGNSGMGMPSPFKVDHLAQQIDYQDLLNALRTLVEARYYGPFRNAINQGAGPHFDLQVGTSFIDLWDRWKTGGVRKHADAIGEITDALTRLFRFDRLEINASQHQKTLMVVVNGKSYRLSELGAGLAQFIIVLGNAAAQPPTLLLIDEPETNLHPALQKDFLLLLAQYARYSVVFTTHSIGLARTVADRIYSIRRPGPHAIITEFSATTNYSEFVGELSFSTFQDLGYDRVLFVEGVTDVRTVQQFLRMVKKEHSTVVVPLGGDQLTRGDREHELSELTRLSKHIFALVDSERTADKGLESDNRRAFLESCAKLKIPVLATKLRAIENYFPARAVREVLGETYDPLGPFQLLSDAAKPWPKTRNWQIAARMTWDDIKDTDIGEFLSML